MKNLIKKHVIRVLNMKDEGCSQLIEENLKNFLGIREVKADNRQGKIDVTYNLKFINYKAVGEKLTKLGYPPAKSFHHSIKSGFINFTEKNEKINHDMKSSNYNANPQGNH